MTSPFALVPVEVLLDDRLTKVELRVLGAILTFRNRDTNLARPTRDQIAERCGYPVTRVSAATASLVSKGWLEKVGKGGRGQAVEYRFMVPETVTDSVTVSDDKTVTEPVTVTESETVTDLTLNGYGIRNETVTESVTPTDHTDHNRPERVERARRASRLSVETLPDDWRDFCAANRDDLDPYETFQKFRDYWIAKPGSGGTKLDWTATWRNWVRNESRGNSNVKHPPQRKGTIQRAMEAFDDAEGHDKTGTGSDAGKTTGLLPDGRRNSTGGVGNA